MRLHNDYRFTSAIKDRKHSIPRKRKIEKIREDEFKEELETTLSSNQSDVEKERFSHQDL